MKITCEDARSLVPGYMDAQLTEAQASPLRAHLLDCGACRESAKEGRALQRWFEPLRDESVTVPEGFAARVARRALAGDPGLLVPVEPPALAPRRSQLGFLLVACSVAAAILFVLALVIQRQSLPTTNGLEAQNRPPWLTSAEAPANQGSTALPERKATVSPGARPAPANERGR